MSKANPLAGLIGNYGDSDESDDEMVHVSYGVPSKKNNNSASTVGQDSTPNYAGIHPAPIQHCPWSACYDESSGFTYYWNQQTNAVTWEAPPEYLLALKIAQQQLHSAGSAEVSAEEWQLYQQVLAEKQNTQNKMIAKAAITNLNKSSKNDSLPVKDNNKSKTGKKRPPSDDEDEKIELITSYHNSDSESNDEAESPTKMQPIAPTVPKKSAVKVQKNVHKKQKTKLHVEYGPSMPPNMNYTVPIGPELPPNLEITPESKPTENKLEIVTIAKEPEKKSPISIDNEDSQDEISLLKKLKDKAKLLEKLGGELPTELQQIIKDESNLSATASPSSVDDMNKKNIDIDDMLEEIEKTEFLKTKSKETKSNKSSVNNSPRSDGHRTPPLEELKTLFPSTKNHNNEPIPTLFPSVANFEGTSKPPSPEQKPALEKKENMYLMNVNERIENVSRKKLRISNSVLPERKIEKSEPPAYTTKYSQYIEGFSDQRTGLGFKEDVKCDSPKNTISYGNGLTFTKGETLNEGKQEEDLRDLTDLIGAKLKYLNELQPSVVTPVQEMLIQLQTLVSGWSCGGVSAQYVRRWAGGAGAALAQHEAEAAPPGWTCTFQRSAGRYRYRREADGLQQWEYPALDNTDMDISTTPPHSAPTDNKEEASPPQPSSASPVAPLSPPAPPSPARAATPPAPPPPRWHEPPPPGCDDPPPPPPPPPPPASQDAKVEICEELMCFYNDIAELEKQSEPVTETSETSEPPSPPDHTAEARDRARERDRERDARAHRKKSKVKISTSMGLKHKSVSNLVAKWQQVADEIHSD